MLFALILVGLVLVLLTGIPVFSGLMLFAAGILYAAEGHLGGIGDLVFGKLDTYLLVSIPLFTLMAHFMIRGKVVDDLFGAAHTLLRHLPGGMGIATVAACTVFAAISGVERGHGAHHRFRGDPADDPLRLQPALRLRRGRRRRHARHPDPAVRADGAVRRRVRHLDRRAVHGRTSCRD